MSKKFVSKLMDKVGGHTCTARNIVVQTKIRIFNQILLFFNISFPVVSEFLMLIKT